jgi:hypothetical protein
MGSRIILIEAPKRREVGFLGHGEAQSLGWRQFLTSTLQPNSHCAIIIAYWALVSSNSFVKEGSMEFLQRRPSLYDPRIASEIAKKQIELSELYLNALEGADETDSENWTGILHLALRAGVTKEQMLDRLDVVNSTLHRWLLGHTCPPLLARTEMKKRFLDIVRENENVLRAEAGAKAA